MGGDVFTASDYSRPLTSRRSRHAAAREAAFAQLLTDIEESESGHVKGEAVSLR